MGKKKRAVKPETLNLKTVSAAKPDIRLFLLISMALVVVTLIPYLQCLNHDFISYYDDDLYVTSNFYIRDGLCKAISWAFMTYRAANWHPLTWISLALDYQVYGLDTMGFHLTNILLHLLNTILLFLVLSRMTKAVWKSAFVAALFAIHPVHVESVAWVCERKDVLSILFWLLTMYAYVVYAEKPNIGRYALVFLGLGLGLMAKPMLVSLPLVLLMLDYWPLNRFGKVSITKLVLEKLPLFALVLGSCIITFIAQKHGGAVGSLESVSVANRIGNSSVSYIAYILKMLWPSKLAIFYPLKIQDAGMVILSTVTFAALSVLAIYYGRKSRYLLVGWLWYVITLMPVIGLVQVGTQAMADRYTYVTLIGLFMIAAWGIPDLLKRKDSTLGIAAGFVIVILTACTCVQAGYWQNNSTVFSHAADVTSDNFVAYSNLSTMAKDQGNMAKAMEYAQEAVNANPNYAPSQVALANILLIDNVPQAIEHYRQAIKLNPDHTIAHNNLGTALISQNDLAGAEKEFSEALRVDPYYPEAYINLGVVKARQGKLINAVEDWERAAELSPDNQQVHKNLAIALCELGRYSDAWAEIDLCEKCGGTPDPRTVQQLSRVMPRPAR